MKNNKWYKFTNGSTYFKTGEGKGFGFSESSKTFNTSNVLNFEYLPNNWNEVKSPEEVLEIIQKGMKSRGYDNNVLIKGIHRSSLTINEKDLYVKLKKYHFNFKDKEALSLLMNRGQLWLENSNLPNDYICILKNGKLSKKVDIDIDIFDD